MACDYGGKGMKYEHYVDDFAKILSRIESGQLSKFINLLMDAYEGGKSIYVIGNGGSAANASHFAQDLAKGCRGPMESEKRFRAISLTDNTPFITALSNDDGYQYVFEQQLMTYAGPGDMLVAISGSGNSPNVIRAVEWANRKGLTTVGITGYNGGRLISLAKYSVHVPLNDMCTAESVHSVLLHYIVLEIQEKLNIGCGRQALR